MTMKNRRNYYRILQVQPDASFEIIRASYRTLMRELKHHPDLGGDQWNAGILNEAYGTLANKDKRDEYDKTLFETYFKKPFPGENPGKKPVIGIFCPFCKRPLSRRAKPGEGCPACRSPLQVESDGGAFDRWQRRSSGRVRKAGKLRYYSSWPQKERNARMIDLSPKGIRFICNEELRRESTIKLSSSLLSATAKVTNFREQRLDGETCYTVGAQFLAVTFAKTKGTFISTFA